MVRNPLTALLKKMVKETGRKELVSDSPAYLPGRRKFIQNAAVLAAGAGIIPGLFDPARLAAKPDAPKIAIVGAGMAGLNTAYQLVKLGIVSTVYEASARAGGRMFSIQDKFGKGLSTDLGGEFVDTTHEDILQLAHELDQAFYDLRNDKMVPKTFYFEGRTLDEQDLREAIRPFAKQIISDARSLPKPLDYTTAKSFEKLDSLSITAYIRQLGIKGWLYNFLDVVLTREYGMEASEQSAINFLIMFTEPVENSADYELFGDDHEILKIKGGSQQLTDKLFAKLGDTVKLNHKLISVSGTQGKGYQLIFQHAGLNQRVEADYIVMAIPFSILRNLKLDIEMPDAKRKCIQELGYGNSGKFIMGMKQKAWRAAKKQGYTFNDLSFGCGWDSSQMQSADSGSFTVFAGGNIIEEISHGKADDLVAKYLPALDLIYPGAKQGYSGSNVKFCWSKYPFTAAGYSAFKKGQWSTIAGWEAVPVGNVYFAGEHVSLDFQGYMNGAAKTGKAAANAIWERINAEQSEKRLGVKGALQQAASCYSQAR